MSDALETNHTSEPPLPLWKMVPFWLMQQHDCKVLFSYLQSMGDVPNVSNPGNFRNTPKDAIFSAEAKAETSQDILTPLNRKQIPVADIHRLPSSKEASNSPCQRILLSFSTPHPPSRIKIGFTSFTVHLYILRPRRWFKYRKFGHIRKYCWGTTDIYSNCGSDFHLALPNPPCSNCGDKHSTASRNSSVYVQESKVLEICTVQKFDRRKAKRKLEGERRSFSLTYAASMSTGPWQDLTPTIFISDCSFSCSEVP